MRTIAAVSQKGGVGRTTVSMNLAAMHAGRTLVIDLDPQRSAYDWGAERQDRAPDVMVGVADRLAHDLDEARRDAYDLVIIDTPPLAEREAAKAASLADLTILPVRPSRIDLLSLRVSVEMLRRIGKQGVAVICQAPVMRNSAVVRETIQEIEGMGCQVSPALIRARVAFQHSRIDGRVAAEFEPSGAAAGEIALLLADLMSRFRIIENAGKPETRSTRQRVVA